MFGVNEQTVAFVNAIIMGIVMGVMLDIVTVAFMYRGKIFRFVTDMFLAFAYAIMFFWYTLAWSNGVIRGFVIAGMLVGIALYFISVSQAVTAILLFISKFVSKVLRNIKKFLKKPLKFK